LGDKKRDGKVEGVQIYGGVGEGKIQIWRILEAENGSKIELIAKEYFHSRVKWENKSDMQREKERRIGRVFWQRFKRRESRDPRGRPDS